MAKFKMPKISSPKTKVSIKARTPNRTKPSVKVKFSSKGHSISSKNLSAKQAAKLFKRQGKYELARAKAGLMSEPAMRHLENMAKIKASQNVKISSMAQLTGATTTLGGTALATQVGTKTGSAQVQVNGGLTGATQGRPNTTPSLKPQEEEELTGQTSKPGKDWADIIGETG